MSLDLPTGPSRPTDYDQVRARQDADRETARKHSEAMQTRMEPDCARDPSISQAISLKRIADALERRNHLVYDANYFQGAGDPPPTGGTR